VLMHRLLGGGEPQRLFASGELPATLASQP
jgi:hypothetical protein